MLGKMMLINYLNSVPYSPLFPSTVFGAPGAIRTPDRLVRSLNFQS